MKKLILASLVFAISACSSDKSQPSSNSDSKKNTPPTKTSAPISSTQPNVYEFFSAPEAKKTSIHIYTESEIWIVEKNTIAEDGLPDPSGRWTFTTKENAYSFAQSQLGVSESVKNPKALDQEVGHIPTLLPPEVSEDLATNTGLWVADKQWTWEWEIEFAKWMRTNLHPQFFQELGIENDCADAYYQSRMIFARLNKLPVAFRLAGGGAWFTQNTMRSEWKKLATHEDWTKDKRFMQALEYVANTTYTHTLGRDTYPVELTQDGLIEGTAFLYLDEISGHTLLVNEINLNNVDDDHKNRLPMYTLNSTVPKGLQPLTESFFYASTQPEKTDIGRTGFVRFRWPKVNSSAALVAEKDMPYFSEEQYDPNLMLRATDPTDSADEVANPIDTNFSIFVFKRINPNFDPALRITEGIKELGEMLNDRLVVVEQGYAVCQQKCIEGDANYEAWSTPSRDKRIKQLMKDLEDYQSYLGGTDQRVYEQWKTALISPILTFNGTSYLLQHIQWTWNNDYFSSNPNDIPDARWGIAPEYFAIESYNEILPVLKTRKNKIDTDSSCATCQIFSVEYLKSSTFKEDSEIAAITSTRNNFCLLAGEALCKRFESTLETQSTLVPIHANFLETWKNSGFFNSDPRASVSARWGAPFSFENQIVIEGQWQYDSIAEDGLIMLRRDLYPQTSYAFVDSANSRKVILSKTYGDTTQIYMNPRTSLLAAVNSAQKTVQIINPYADSVIQEFPLPKSAGTYIYSVTWINATRLAVRMENTIIIYDNIGLGIPTINEYTGFNEIKGDYIIQSTPKEITVVNASEMMLFPVTINIESILAGAQPTYFSVQSLTRNTLLINWSDYSSSPGKYGRFIINVLDGMAYEVPSLFSDYFQVVEGVSFMNKDDSTIIAFVDDNLSVLNTLTINGSCYSCSSPNRPLQIGNKIYSLNKEAQTLQTIATLPSDITLTDSYGSLALFAHSGDSTFAPSNSLVDLQTGKVMLTQQSLNFTNIGDSLSPFISSSYSIEKVVNEGTPQAMYYYYNFEAILDPLDLSKGSLYTTSTAGNYSGEEGDGEDGHGDIEAGMMAGITTMAASLTIPPIENSDFKPVKMKAPKISIENGGYTAPTVPNLRVLNLNNNTILIFNK